MVIILMDENRKSREPQITRRPSQSGQAAHSLMFPSFYFSVSVFLADTLGESFSCGFVR